MIQSRITTKRLPNPNGKYTYLKSSEIMYLRLYLHDLSDETICKFMDRSSKNIKAIRIQLERKFKTTDWRIIIALAIDRGYLNIVDFAEKDVKLDALHFTEELYEYYIITNAQNDCVKKTLNDFYSKNKKRAQTLYNNSPKNHQLTKNELDFIAFHFEEKHTSYTSYQSQASSVETKVIKLLLRKLQVNNWFNLYRKVHLLNLINNITDLNSDTQAINTLNKLDVLKQIRNLKPYEKKLTIYNGLLESHLDLEFHSLLCNI